MTSLNSDRAREPCPRDVPAPHGRATDRGATRLAIRPRPVRLVDLPSVRVGLAHAKKKKNKPPRRPTSRRGLLSSGAPMPSIRHTLTTDDGEFLVYTETPAGDTDNMELLDD